MEEKTRLPDDVFWPYSYPPYDIQVSLMNAVQKTLDEGKCGIFESPTGTGKTSSIICSVVPWLIRNWEKQSDKTTASQSSSNSQGEPSWLQEHEADVRKRNLQRLAFLRKRRDARFVEQEKLHASSAYEPGKRVKRGGNRISLEESFSSGACSDEDDYDEDEDEEALDRKEEEEDFSRVRKMYFCSRTHTQLSQFLAEVKRVYPNDDITAVTLGSRTHLCINEDLRSKYKAGGNRLNDACLDLQDSSSSQKCPYLKDPKSVTLVADAELYRIRDMEDVLSYAKAKGGCAYYASREAAKSASIVVLPYSALLSSGTREALGIDLTDAIVVCDEAHNLIDAVSDAHSCQVSLQQLANAKSEIKAYLEKYAGRFNLDNVSFLAELASVATKLAAYLEKVVESRVLVLDEFAQQSRIEDNNIFELVKRARDAQLNKKLKGIARELSKENTSIQPVITFLDALKNISSDGRISVTPKSSLRFLLLNPGTKFAQVVEKAHSVILAGGTMHPVDDVVQQLFPSKKEVALFSCGHIVPCENLRVLQAGFGPTNKEIRLTFDTRNDPQTLDEISSCIRNICSVCPDGVVVFLPSYSFQETLCARWDATGFTSTLQKALVKEKRFKIVEDGKPGEPTSESAFQEYERLVTENPSGCLLLAVVGGKLSEGINFSDHLARCVVMVGMPYPNRHDPELASKMAFIDEQHGKGAGNRYFENQCWKAVNQSVGRSIRHKNDYAAVVFLDSRYASSQDKLPGWISERFERCAEWNQVSAGLTEFFRTKPKRALALGFTSN